MTVGGGVKVVREVCGGGRGGGDVTVVGWGRSRRGYRCGGDWKWMELKVVRMVRGWGGTEVGGLKPEVVVWKPVVGGA